MSSVTFDLLQSRFRKAAFALASEHFPAPTSSDDFPLETDTASSSEDVALALLELPYTLSKKQMFTALRRRFPKFSPDVVYEWRYMCLQIVKALEDELDSVILEDPKCQPSPPIVENHPIDSTAPKPSTNDLQHSPVSDEPCPPAFLFQTKSLPLPNLFSKTRENRYMEENTTQDVEESAPSSSMDSSPVSVKQNQEKQDDSSDSDHVSYAHNALTQSAISSSPIAVVEHAKAHTDSVIPVQPSSTPPSASKNGFVVGAAQVVPLDIVSSSSDSRKALPSSPRSAVGQVTLSTPSLGTAESSVPCMSGKRDHQPPMNHQRVPRLLRRREVRGSQS